MWIVLHTYFIWCNEEERGRNILTEYQLPKQEPFPILWMTQWGWGLYGAAVVNGRGPWADTDLVDRVTSAGIQGVQGLWWLPVCFLLLIHHISCVCYAIYSQARMWIDCLVSLFIQMVILVFFCYTSRLSPSLRVLMGRRIELSPLSSPGAVGWIESCKDCFFFSLSQRSVRCELCLTHDEIILYETWISDGLCAHSTLNKKISLCSHSEW